MSHITAKFETARQSNGQKRLTGARPPKAPPAPRVPHVAKLMALAIRLEDLLESGQVRDQAELARLGHVTRARLTQVMDLLHLAPDIQEAILHPHHNMEALRNLTERHTRRLVRDLNWKRQRAAWRVLLEKRQNETLPGLTWQNSGGHAKIAKTLNRTES